MTVDEADLVEIGGALITTPLRTAYDCARLLPLVEGVVVADALGHSRQISAEGLESFVATHRGARGIRTADQVVDLMDDRSESPMETRLRVLLVLEGMPPEPQFKIYDAKQIVARADLAYPDHHVVVEYDCGHPQGSSGRVSIHRRAIFRARR
jgi:hypothetical protein